MIEEFGYDLLGIMYHVVLLLPVGMHKNTTRQQGVMPRSSSTINNTACAGAHSLRPVSPQVSALLSRAHFLFASGRWVEGDAGPDASPFCDTWLPVVPLSQDLETPVGCDEKNADFSSIP